MKLTEPCLPNAERGKPWKRNRSSRLASEHVDVCEGMCSVCVCPCRCHFKGNIVVVVIVDYHPADRGRSLRVVLNVPNQGVSCGLRTWLGIHSFRIRSPNRPSSTNGVPSELTVCAWPVISAPGTLAHRYRDRGDI